MLSFYEWKTQFAYICPGTCEGQEGTMEETMLVFFYNGICPLIKDIGYKWSQDDRIVAKEFIHLCYMINTTAKIDTINLKCPSAKHRNLQEDRETFDYFLDTNELVDFLAKWHFRSEVIGTRFDHLIKEFCYVWVDVCSGKPGAFTQRIFDAEDEMYDEEEQYTGPDMSSKKKCDLY